MPSHIMSIMELSERQKVGRFALYSRILVIFMQAVFNFLIPDHDAGAFSPPISDRQGRMDDLVEVLLGGFRRWDALYFMHVAEHGYTYENTLAFFPLLPMAIRILANSAFLPLQYCMSYDNVLLISATVFNIVCFVQAAKYLCDLTVEVIGNRRVALKVVQLFCLNPASIFFSAPYSEGLFAVCSFGGMLHLERNNVMKAACYFALSGATRSNGLINMAFIWHRQLKGVIETLTASNEATRTVIGRIMRTIFETFLCSLIMVTPFFMYQYYATSIFCNPSASYRDMHKLVLNYGNAQHYKMPHTGMSRWCRDQVPLSYSYVQRTHWEVGFMAYYTAKQIPNFLLALPVVLIGLAASLTFVRHNLWCCLTLGLVEPTAEGTDKKTDEPIRTVRVADSFSSDKNFVYLVHAVALITFAMLFMHVQVTTRFLCCSSPTIYFYLAWITTSKEDRLTPQPSNAYNGHTTHTTGTDCGDVRQHDDTIQAFLEWDNSYLNQVIYVYLHAYFFIGIAAFSNFLPWT